MAWVTTAELVCDGSSYIRLVDRTELCFLRLEGGHDASIRGRLSHVLKEIGRISAVDKVGGEETERRVGVQRLLL